MQSDEKYEGELPNEIRNLIEERMKSGGEGENLIDGLKREGVLAVLIQALKERGGEDFEFEENAVRALVRAAERGGLSSEEKSEVKAVWKKLGTVGQNERGLGGEDGIEATRALA